MSNYIFKKYVSNVSNIYPFNVEWGDSCYEEMIKVARRRFVNSAGLLPEGGFLGLQLYAENDKSFFSFAFSDSDAVVTQKDYEWIFANCASLKNEFSVSEVEPEKHYNYCLRYRPDHITEERIKTEDSECLYSYGDNFYAFFKLMAETCAVINIMARSAGCGSGADGEVLISLPSPITLRMRSALSILFPGTEMVPASDFRYENDRIPSSVFTEILGSILISLSTKTEEEDTRDMTFDDDESLDGLDECFDECFDSPFEETDDENITAGSSSKPVSIDELEFSVRTYNCLKRSGIDTLEQLKSLSVDELAHIRNLGKKSFDEVQEKLANLEPDLLVGCSGSVKHLATLDELIGLEDVKEQVKKITAYGRLKQDLEKNGKNIMPIVLNMEFVGNPGTAKTTVARIFARIFHDAGILSSEEIMEVGRADLVGKYVGQTAIKVKDVFACARDRLLFIDEAYSLLDDREGSFGDEAISTIVQEMENNRDRTIVIFAGYPDKMADFFERNPGLRSRVPFTISFKDYTPDEMVNITELEASKRGFTIDSQAIEKIKGICKSASSSSENGNGRFCRNLAENAILEYADRLYSKNPGEVENTYVLSAEDFKAPVNMSDEPRNNPIGFLV